MPRTKTLIVPDGTEGRGYGEDIRFNLSGDERADIARAVTIEHGCNDEACDIAAAMENDCPFSAAYLLWGATETPLLDAVLNHYGRDLKYPDDLPDWDDWKKAHERYGICCDSCGAYTYGDDFYIPEVCGNCLSRFPDQPDYESDAFIRPSGYLGSKTSASFDGKFLGEFDSDRRALAAILLEMKRYGYYPNVWQVSDHGNVSQIIREGWPL